MTTSDVSSMFPLHCNILSQTSTALSNPSMNSLFGTMRTSKKAECISKTSDEAEARDRLYTEDNV